MNADNFDDILDFFIQNYSFDEVQTLKAALNEIEKDPQAACNVLKDRIRRVEKRLLDDEICPECGARMMSIPCPEEDTYVPYGDTKVLYSEATYLSCPHCGYIPEE
nr:MAG TPA: MqsA [Caudoviricetes sp.]